MCQYFCLQASYSGAINTFPTKGRCVNISVYRIHSVVLSIFIQQKVEDMSVFLFTGFTVSGTINIDPTKAFFFASNLSSSGHSHVDSLFATEEWKKIGSAYDVMYICATYTGHAYDVTGLVRKAVLLTAVLYDFQTSV